MVRWRVMNDYAANTSLEQIAQVILASASPVLVTHAKPDGDAFGSVVALARALRLAGLSPSVWLVPPVPASLTGLPGSELTHILQPGQVLPDSGRYVVIDTGAWGQIAPFDEPLRAKAEKLIVIDHHLSGDIAAPLRYVDGQAAACAEIIAQLVDELALQCKRDLMDSIVAQMLFVGIASDTGWFRFSNTRQYTHELAARLLGQGVDQGALYERLEQSDRPEKLALLQRALDGLEFLADGQAAVMVLSQADFEQTGARLEETEQLVDLPRRVQGVQVVALVTEPPAPMGQVAPVRISFRSRSGPQAVNVAQLAAQFGGGGHARASGAKIQAPLASAVVTVKDAVTQAVRQAAGQLIDQSTSTVR